MRLFLASEGIPDPQRLVDVFGVAARVAVVANALDGHASRDATLAAELDRLARLGFTPAEIDLRALFDTGPEAARRALADHDAVWVTGGNTFVVARAFACSGVGDVVRARVRADTLAYGGYSAGAALAASRLDGIAPMDEPHLLPEGYDASVEPRGLALVPFLVVPHATADAVLAQRCTDACRAVGVEPCVVADDDPPIVLGA